MAIAFKRIKTLAAVLVTGVGLSLSGCSSTGGTIEEQYLASHPGAEKRVTFEHDPLEKLGQETLGKNFNDYVIVDKDATEKSYIKGVTATETDSGQVKKIITIGHVEFGHATFREKGPGDECITVNKEMTGQRVFSAGDDVTNPYDALIKSHGGLCKDH